LPRKGVLSSLASMATEDRLTACPHCDAVQDLPPLGPGQQAQCCCCGKRLARSAEGLEERLGALALTGGLLFALANGGSFLAMEAAGSRRSMRLIESPFILAEQGYPVIGALVGCFILTLPLMALVLAAALLAALRFGSPARAGGALVVEGLMAVKTWAMPDVFLLGALVSMVKLSGMAEIGLGPSFWAFAGFVLTYAALMEAVGRRELWDLLLRRGEA